MKKMYLLPILVILAVGSAMAILPSMMTSSSSTSDGLQYHAVVCKEVYRADGTVEDIGCGSNILVNNGRNMIQDRMTGSQTGNLSVINVGGNLTAMTTASTNISNIFNAASGLSPAVGAIYNATDPLTQVGNTSVTHTFTAAADNLYVNQTGLSNESLLVTSGAALFAGEGFTNVVLQTNDQLNVTWYWWVS